LDHTGIAAPWDASVTPHDILGGGRRLKWPLTAEAFILLKITGWPDHQKVSLMNGTKQEPDSSNQQSSKSEILLGQLIKLLKELY